MNGNTILVLAGLAALIVLLQLVKGGGKTIGGLPVVARPLMTDMERRTIGLLEDALPGTRIHAQVSMGALMKPKSGLDRSTRTSTFNRFSSRRVDFVVEDRATGRILMLVELDDRTHDRRSDQDRDRLTARAGYVTVRLPASERPSAESVQRHIAAAVGPNTSAHETPGRDRQTTQAA